MSIENYKKEIATLEQNGNIEALKQMKNDTENPVAEFAQQAIDRLLKKQEEGKLSQNYAENKVGTEKAGSLTAEIDDEINQLNLDMQKEIESVMNEDENLKDSLGLEENNEEVKKELTLEEVDKFINEFDKYHAKRAAEVSSVKILTKEEMLKSLEGKEAVSDEVLDAISEKINKLEALKTQEEQRIRREYFASEEFQRITKEKEQKAIELENTINDKASLIHTLHKLSVKDPEDKSLKFSMRKYLFEKDPEFDLTKPGTKKEIIDIILYPELRKKLMESELKLTKQQDDLIDSRASKYSKRYADQYLK